MNINDFELKLYEVLGIKLFGKFLFFIYNSLDSFRYRNLDVETKKMLKRHVSNNYVMRKSDNMLDDLKSFKKHIRNNTIIHVIALLFCFPVILMSMFIGVRLSTIIPAAIFTIINTYCIMLQRYNNIKINRTIKKYELREKMRKEMLQHELENAQSKLDQQIDIVAFDREDNQTAITFEEFLQLASLKQLKEYKQFLNDPNGLNSSYFYINVKNIGDLQNNKKQINK